MEPCPGFGPGSFVAPCLPGWSAIKRCESHVLPGFESAVREGEAAKVEAERLALEEAMRAPAQSIESAAGRIEHDGPLFQGKIHAMLF